MARKQRVDYHFTDVRIDPASPVPKHRQVYAALRNLILSGKLGAGDALPSTRELARELPVSRNTILSAYELLLSEGFLTGRAGAGTYVAQDAVRHTGARTPLEPRPLSSTAEFVRRAQPPLFFSPVRAFRPSSPAFDAFPYTTWSRIVARMTRAEGRRMMTDADPQGFPALRELIAARLRAVRSCRCDADQVIICLGAQMAFVLCTYLLMENGEPAWFEEPGYIDARVVFRTRSERVVPVPLDESGIDIGLGRALEPRPNVIYLTPGHQWPLGFTMPIQRRLAVLAFAAESGAWVVEDDYDGDLRYDGKTYAALQGLDEADRVIHIGSFSKTMYPGLRLGYLVVPPDLVDAFVAGRRVIDKYPSIINQLALAEFIERGFYGAHVHKMRALYAERHELLRARITARLGGILEAKPATAGTFTVTELAPGYDDVAVVRELLANGIDALPLSAAFAGPPTKRGLVLGHAGAPPHAIRHGVDVLERVLTALTPAARNS